MNAAQRQLVIQKLQEKLFILKGRTIGLLGLAFKPDTDDLRDAPSLHIAERLLQMGARVKAYDPIAMSACREQRPDLKIRYCESAQDLAAEADALVLVTEWDGVRRLDLAALARAMSTRHPGGRPQPVLAGGRHRRRFRLLRHRPVPPRTRLGAAGSGGVTCSCRQSAISGQLTPSKGRAES